MKTTLKRGIGRSAELNGNGRAVLPPTVLAEISRYRQPPPPRRGFFHAIGRIALWLMTTLATVAAGLAGGAYLFFEQSVEDIKAHTPEVKLVQKELDIPLPGEPAIALVVGYDKRAGDEAEINGARSDTVMLVRADPDAKSVSMLSFPRDLVAEIRCPGRLPFTARINEAYTQCGPRGTLDTVRNLTGLPINYLVTVNFRGFKQMVARLGGVWLDVDRRYFNDNSFGTNYATIDLEPGYQKVSGSDALDFVRYRHTDSDLYRLARQQLFVQAFKEAVTTSFSPTSIPKIVGVITDNVEIGAPGGKLSSRTLWGYGLLAYQLPQGHFFQSKIDISCYGDDDVSAITVDQSCINAAVDDFANPDVEAPEKATAVAVGIKPKSKAPPATKTTILVLNGNGVPGAAADTSFQLAQRRYAVVSPPNGARADAPSYDYYRTKLYFDPEQTGSKPAAQKASELFGQTEIEPIPAEIAPLANGAMLVVVVGQTFGGTLAPAPIDRTPQRQPPAVVSNPEAARVPLQEAQRKVPFPLQLPTVIERSSALTGNTPVRVYQLAGRNTVRVTFSTGASEYWGIQMIRWNSAPALREPNRKLFIKGRRYELHYSGSHLRMVVLREQGASYWVVNTLLNTLSNETMLAIAKGLKPLGNG